jgi:septum formation protein
VHTAHFLRHVASGRTGLLVASAAVVCGEPPAAELERYLESGQWRGKAGSYGVQDDAQGFFRVESGSFDTVVGLHVPAVRELLLRLREPA